MVDALRIRFGFPLQVFEIAVRTVVERYLAELEVNARDECAVRRLVEVSIPLVARALDLRRAQVLPRGAVPEVIGEQMHRWTYAVFVGALLRGDVRSNASSAPTSSSADSSGTPCAQDDRALAVIVRCVLPSIYAWLCDEERVLDELEAYLSGVLQEGGNAIGEIVEAAAMDVPGSGAVPRTGSVGAQASSSSVATKEGVGAWVGRGLTNPASAPVRTIAVPAPVERGGHDRAVGKVGLEAAGTAQVEQAGARTDLSEGRLSAEAQRFMQWLAAGIADGTLAFNEPQSAIHFVEEGMLLVLPGVLRSYCAQTLGETGLDASVPSDLRRARRREIRAALLAAGEGVCVGPRTYRLQCAGDDEELLTGLVIVGPQRFISRVPRTNPDLVRVERVPER